VPRRPETARAAISWQTSTADRPACRGSWRRRTWARHFWSAVIPAQTAAPTSRAVAAAPPLEYTGAPPPSGLLGEPRPSSAPLLEAATAASVCPSPAS
jgi:hypothetical protein